MLFVDNQGITDPSVNLAIEEYILKHLPMDDSYLLFYINRPSIIIGKHQNTIEEINIEYVQDNNVQVVRRLSAAAPFTTISAISTSASSRRMTASPSTISANSPSLSSKRSMNLASTPN